MRFPRVLVLGATGRVGTILRRCWPPRAALWQGRRAGSAAGPGWVFVDPLAEPAALARAASQCRAVLCLAGVTPPAAAAGRPLKDNTALAAAAIRAGAAAGARVLLASSAAVYGDRPGALAETATPAPVSDYGRSKLRMERRGADLAARLGVEICALRIGNIAGADAALGGWRPGFRLDRFADGRGPRRSYIGPLTLARVLGDLLAAPDLPAVLNVAAPGVVGMDALLDAAGLDWAARPADGGAIAEIGLDLRALERLVRFSESDSRPETMVRQWRMLEPDGGLRPQATR